MLSVLGLCSTSQVSNDTINSLIGNLLSDSDFCKTCYKIDSAEFHVAKLPWTQLFKIGVKTVNYFITDEKYLCVYSFIIHGVIIKTYTWTQDTQSTSLCIWGDITHTWEERWEHHTVVPPPPSSTLWTLLKQCLQLIPKLEDLYIAQL